MTENIFSLQIFNGINHSTIEEIINSSEQRSFNPGETILLEWSSSNGEGYIIKSGSVEVSIKGNSITYLTDGEIFWEIALLNEENRTATVQATTSTTVIVITLEHILQMINSGNQSINETIIKRIEENLQYE